MTGKMSRTIVIVVVASLLQKKNHNPRLLPRRCVARPQRPVWSNDKKEGDDDGQEFNVGDENNDDREEGEEGNVREADDDDWEEDDPDDRP